MVFVRDWRQLLYWAIFFSAFSATSLLNIESLTFGITPYIYFSVLYCGAALVTGAYRGLTVPASFRDTALLGIGAFALVVLLATVIAGIKGRAGLGHITQTAYLFLGLLMTGVVAFALGDAGARAKSFRALRYGGMFVAAWGLFQLVSSYAGFAYPSGIFNNSVSDFADLYDQKLAGGIHRISSVSVEPSFLAFSLVHVFAFSSTRMALASGATRMAELPTVLLTGTCLVLSTSTTAYVGLLVCAMLLMLAQPIRAAITAGLLALVATVLLLYFSGFAAVLDEVTLSKFDTWSFKDRIANTHRGWELFLSQPALGGGWGSAQDSLPVLLLANAGMIGLVFFLLAMAWTLFGTGKALAARPDAAARELWLDCAGCQAALYASLAMSIASGFKYVVFDFWFMWGASIATVAALHWSMRAARSAARPPAADTQMAAMRGATVWNP
jgi:hypothetical protein